MKIMPQSGGFFRPIEELKGRKDPEALRAAAKEIEALFAYELIKAMRQTSPSTGGGIGADTYTSLFDMEVARLLSERGLGLKELLLKNLTQEPEKEHGGMANAAGLPPVFPQERFPQPPVSGTLPPREHNEVREAAVPGPAAPPDHMHGGLPVAGEISSGFGMRTHPLHGDMRFHHGIDIAAPEGTAIYPFRGGTVVFSGEQPGYGKTVVIDHGDGLVSKYAHNSVNHVKTGDSVDENTVIAEVGSTGISTGPHLHFEIRADGRSVDPITLIAAR